jgi:hypothetical protein
VEEKNCKALFALKIDFPTIMCQTTNKYKSKRICKEVKLAKTCNVKKKKKKNQYRLADDVMPASI